MNIAFIPARGGSTRIPDKNLQVFHGKTLIEWAIKNAKDSKCFDRIVVSTDSMMISELALARGAEVDKRPSWLADVHTHNWVAACEYASRKLKDANVLTLISPTVPLIGGKTVRLVTRLVETHVYPSVITSTEINPAYWRSVYIAQDGTTRPIVSWEALHVRSQDCPRVLHLNYGVMAARNKDLQEYGGYIMIPDLYIYPVGEQPDIDNIKDLTI